MTLVRRYDWSGTPFKAGLGPAAAHCAELRSFRRGCMALRLCEDNMWKPLITTELFVKSFAMHVVISSRFFCIVFHFKLNVVNALSMQFVCFNMLLLYMYFYTYMYIYICMKVSICVDAYVYIYNNICDRVRTTC